MTFEEKVALTILILALIGLGTVITWTLRLIKFLFIKIFCTYKITITKRDDAPKPKKKPSKPKQPTQPQYSTKTILFPNKKAKDDYYESAYFFAKRESYDIVINDLGKYGEYLIYDYLKDYQKSDGRFLFNCYLPKENNQTTEIDVMLIHHCGIFVFESKNYSGWIFGNDQGDYWTQTLPVKRGVSHKEHFYSPIKQNDLHRKNLKRIVGDSIPIYSIIVFSERCTLKDVSVNIPNVYVIKRNQISMTVSGILINKPNKLETDDINNIYQRLYPYTQVSEEVKRQHIENLNRENVNLPFL